MAVRTEGSIRGSKREKNTKAFADSEISTKRIQENHSTTRSSQSAHVSGDNSSRIESGSPYPSMVSARAQIPTIVNHGYFPSSGTPHVPVNSMYPSTRLPAGSGHIVVDTVPERPAGSYVHMAVNARSYLTDNGIRPHTATVTPTVHAVRVRTETSTLRTGSDKEALPSVRVRTSIPTENQPRAVAVTPTVHSVTVRTDTQKESMPSKSVRTTADRIQQSSRTVRGTQERQYPAKRVSVGYRDTPSVKSVSISRKHVRTGTESFDKRIENKHARSVQENRTLATVFTPAGERTRSVRVVKGTGKLGKPDTGMKTDSKNQRIPGAKNIVVSLSNSESFGDLLARQKIRTEKKNAKVKVNGKLAGKKGVSVGRGTLRVVNGAKLVSAALKKEYQYAGKELDAEEEDVWNQEQNFQKAKQVGIDLILKNKRDTKKQKAQEEHKKEKKSDNLRRAGEEKSLKKTDRKQALKKNKESVADRWKSSKQAKKKATQKIKDTASDNLEKMLIAVFGSLSGALLLLGSGIVIVGVFIMLLLAGAGGSTTNTANSAALNGNAAIICQYFQSQGLGAVQCAAILGNLKQEMSTMDPTYDNGHAMGIMQWTGGQRTKIINWAASKGMNVYDLNTQLQYAWEVYIPSNWTFARYTGAHAYPTKYNLSFEAWKTETDIDIATGAFCACSEKPYYMPAKKGEYGSMLDKRVQFAQEYLNAMMSGGAGGTVVTPLGDGSARLAQLFPGGTPTTQTQMAQYLTTISVPVCDTAGNVRYISIQSHKAIAGNVQACFNEMAALKFPVIFAGSYEWRYMASGTGHLSHHSYGVAFDINAAANGATYTGGVNPSSPYYINQKIVSIWKSHGFYWGGDWKGYYNDPMHFTWTNH